MTRILTYLAIVVALLVGGYIGGYVIASHHYERIQAVKDLAQEKAIAAAQQSVITAEAARVAAEDRAEKAHEVLVKSDADARNRLAGSMRGITASLARCLSAPVAHPGAVPGSAAESAGPEGPAGSTGQLEQALTTYQSAYVHAVAACQVDSEHLAAILSLEPK